MKPADLVKLAMSLPGAHEEPHFDRRSFRVKSKIFMTMKGDDEAMVKVMEPEKRDALFTEHPEIFFSYGGFTRMGAVGVRVKKVDRDLMEHLVVESWRRISPVKERNPFLAFAPDKPAKPRKVRGLADLFVNAGKRNVPASFTTQHFLEKNGVPEKLQSRLVACSFAEAVGVGGMTLHTYAELPQINKKPNHLAMKHGLLVVGTAPNGDPIAVDVKAGTVSFLAHDVLWGFDPEVTGWEECVAPTGLSLLDFWKRANDDPKFPVDFYAASDAFRRAPRARAASGRPSARRRRRAPARP